MFTQEYFKLGYNLQKQAGLFDSESEIASKRKSQIKEYKAFMDKAHREKDINHNWGDEKRMGTLLGIGALGLGAAGIAGVDPEAIVGMGAGGLTGLGSIYGLRKLMSYVYNNKISDDLKRKSTAMHIQGIKDRPGWLV